MDAAEQDGTGHGIGVTDSHRFFGLIVYLYLCMQGMQDIVHVRHDVVVHGGDLDDGVPG